MWNELSANHISNNLANYEAARSGFFTLIVDDSLNGVVSAAYTGSDPAEAAATEKITTAQETLKLNVVQAPVPHFSLTKHSYKRGNDTVNFAGVPEFSDGEIIVDDVVGADTKSVLMAWQNLAYNVHTRKGGRMWQYKKNCTLIEYTQDFQQIRSWKLYGCWVQNINEDAFNKEQDGPRKIRATIVYDRAEMILDKEENEPID